MKKALNSFISTREASKLWLLFLCCVELIIISLLFRWMFIGRNRWQRPGVKFLVNICVRIIFWNFLSCCIIPRNIVVAPVKTEKKMLEWKKYRRLRHNGKKNSYLWIIYVINFGINVCQQSFQRFSISTRKKMLSLVKVDEALRGQTKTVVFSLLSFVLVVRESTRVLNRLMNVVPFVFI